MTTCTGHIINTAGNDWKPDRRAARADLGSSAANHAERVAYNNLTQSACYLLVIDDFPCHTCHAHFLGESLAGHSIIFKVTANAGAYSLDHGLAQKQSVPCMIYYHGGSARYDSLGLRMAGGAAHGPHPNFPAHPAFDRF
jgi:hypothetical protein